MQVEWLIKGREKEERCLDSGRVECCPIWTVWLVIADPGPVSVGKLYWAGLDNIEVRSVK